MPPGSLATTDDLVELAKAAGRHGGTYSAHTRNEGTGVFDAVREMIAIAERAGVPVDIIHIKIADQHSRRTERDDGRARVVNRLTRHLARGDG